MHQIWFGIVLNILLDVAFDILYVGDTSVIHQSLVERHDLLQRIVKPVMGRLQILIPNGDNNCILSHGMM